MHTEIIKIIEGGLSRDVSKVISYARLFASNSRKEGDHKMADRIEKALNSQGTSHVTTDQLQPAPVDHESRLAVADVIYPSNDIAQIILPPSISDGLAKVLALYNHRRSLETAGVEVNNSLLLYGPPGCGKTTLAHHIASTLQLPLIVARFDALVSSLLGSTSKNIRKVFDFASNRPCVLLLDEFDAIGKARDDQHEMGELKRVINSLLQNIDRFTQSGNILIAATNHAELLDKAIWRRFNLVMEMGAPTSEQTFQLVLQYMKKSNASFLNDKKEMQTVLSVVDALSPANLKTICNNAIADAIVYNDGKLTIEAFLSTVHAFKTNHHHDIDSLVKFLNENGISKDTIATYCKIGIRKVNSILPPAPRA